MTRTHFLKSLVSVFGLSVLPVKWVTQYQKIYLLQCFVRGFQYYEGTKLLSQMCSGSMLELVRESRNEYDPSANVDQFARYPKLAQELVQVTDQHGHNMIEIIVDTIT